MTDWWNTDREEPRGESVRVEPKPEWRPESEPAAPAAPEPEAMTVATPPDRRKKLLLGAAGAAVAGTILFSAVPHGGSDPTALPGASATAAQSGDLPAAGGGPGEPSSAPQPSATPVAAKVVTMTVAPSGTGRVGAVVKVTIHNGTDDAITVMSSMMKGDDRSAVLGEGTLAPGARAVQPGETVTGTVEFATKEPPAQVILFDIGGNVVAASG
jgi:hypothetical protein